MNSRETRENNKKAEVMRLYEERMKEYDITFAASTNLPNPAAQIEATVEKIKGADMLESLREVNNFFAEFKTKSTELKEKRDSLDKILKDSEDCQREIGKIMQTVKKLQTSYTSCAFLPKVDFNYEEVQNAINKLHFFPQVNANIDEEARKVNGDIEKLTNKMVEVRELVGNTFNDTVKNSADNLETCKICLDSKITTCCAPCGHCFCATCVSQITRCALCRTTITQKIKLYLDGSAGGGEGATTAAARSTDIGGYTVARGVASSAAGLTGAADMFEDDYDFAAFESQVRAAGISINR
jgi:hypothetical protein